MKLGVQQTFDLNLMHEMLKPQIQIRESQRRLQEEESLMMVINVIIVWRFLSSEQEQQQKNAEMIQ